VIRAMAMPLAIMTTSLAMAAPAAADQDGYLTEVQTRLPNLGAAQLEPEGAKICAFTKGGGTASAAVGFVSKDLGVSIPSAFAIVSSAVGHLGC
jgi:hypothetical protein